MMHPTDHTSMAFVYAFELSIISGARYQRVATYSEKTKQNPQTNKQKLSASALAHILKACVGPTAWAPLQQQPNICLMRQRQRRDNTLPVRTPTWLVRGSAIRASPKSQIFKSQFAFSSKLLQNMKLAESAVRSVGALFFRVIFHLIFSHQKQCQPNPTFPCEHTSRTAVLLLSRWLRYTEAKPHRSSAYLGLRSRCSTFAE